MASIYESMGNNTLAEESLDKAQSLATNDEERYLINYNKAIMNYNRQDFSTALEYARQAKQIKDDSQVNSLINDINLMLNNVK